MGNDEQRDAPDAQGTDEDAVMRDDAATYPGMGPCTHQGCSLSRSWRRAQERRAQATRALLRPGVMDNKFHPQGTKAPVPR